MAYLDETNGRPVQQKFLDLLSLKPNLKEEVQSALHKIPELKLRPEKIPEEENVVKPLSWKSTRDSPYLDPVPVSMLHVDIRELSTVNIDWKMLTLDRPEAQLEIQIFSRMVYLDKLMLKCLMEEKEQKVREKYIRLRTKGRPKTPSDSDVDRSDEFTYEYFSRFSGLNERAQAMEEVPKTKGSEEPKPRPSPANEVPPLCKSPVPPAKQKSKRTLAKKKLKRRKKKKKRKRKAKLRKRKLVTKTKPKAALKTKKSTTPSLRIAKKGKTTAALWKKGAASRTKPSKRISTNKTTLVQMLKSMELKNKRRTIGSKPDVKDVTSKTQVVSSPKR